LLYKRNLLLYDRQTDSLWSQLGGEAVAGPLTASKLKLLPSTETTWSQWKQQHPETLVLSFHTGYRRDYSRDPYKNFPLDRRMALVVRVDGQVKIYPFSQLEKVGASFADNVGGEKLVIGFDARNRTATARGLNGEKIPHFVAFLPDARAFYPHAPIFKMERRR
jgi:Protein of unknown function (DUF3179)